MTMIRRERLLTTIRGGIPDRVPWNMYAWIVPQTEAGRRMQAKGLGVMGNARCCRPIYEGVTIREERFTRDGLPHERRWIETPVGTITEEALFEPHHGSRWIREFYIKSVRDYPVAEYYFRHTRFEPDREAWRRADAEVGEAGVTSLETMCLPILLLYQYWMGPEVMVEGLYEHRAAFDALIDALEGHYFRQMEIAAESEAELIWFPESISAQFISPTLFQRYALPLYARSVPMIRGAGKLITAHYDGTMRPFLKPLATVDIPIIEAFTPPPMGDVTVAEAKAAWPNKTIWVNFPGNLFLESWQAIYDAAMEMMRQGAQDGHLVIGCTEDFPPNQFEKTYDAIGHAMADYEGYRW